MDSRLLLLILSNYANNLTIITSSSKPAFAGNCYDVMTAEKISGIMGKKILIDCMDYAKLDINALDAIIKKMPFSVHTGVNFERMCALAAQENVSAVFCGQNMDTLYNMGPTERTAPNFHGVAQWFKRFYLSEEYFAGLPDVEGRRSLADAAVAKVGEFLFRRVTRRADLRLPHTANELVDNFAHSNDYTVFSSNPKPEIQSGGDVKTPFEVKTELYKTKLAYLKGGDSQAVEVGGFLNNLSVRLPYSDQRMIEFFAELRLKRADVWKPKRFSYMYLKEFSGKYGKEIASFKVPSAKEMTARFGDVRDLYEAFETVLSQTEWGNALSAGARTETNGYTGLMKYNSLFGAYWHRRLMEILSDECGVVIQPV